MASSDAAGRPLTDFEQVLLGVIADEPRSGYGLKKMFNASPASVYQPSPGALYPALRRLEGRGLLRAEKKVSSGHREMRLYHITDAGRAAHLAWLRQPVVPAAVAADLGLYLMRFALMEGQLARPAVLAFLEELADALDRFVSGMEKYVASGAQSSRRHAELALEHGIATHRASLEWARTAMAALAEPPPESRIMNLLGPTAAPGDLEVHQPREPPLQGLRHGPRHAACDDNMTGATVHFMNTPAGPPAAFDTEAAVLGALFSPAGRSDPHVILRSCTLPGCQYLFVRDVLRDPRFAAPSMPPSPDAAFQLLARWMLRLDGDRHRRVRDAFGGLFTARRVERYRAVIAERATALINQAVPAGSMDLVADFARPLPFTAIAEVLGVPPDDRDWLAAAIATLNRGFARQRDADRTAVQAASDAARHMLSYFTALLDQRTAAPADDLMTALAARHADGEDRQDLIANCIFFINAGHQSTTTLLTLGTYLLCTHPRALAELTEDPGRWPAAVEEMLRLITPATFTAAAPRADADVRDVPCAAGEPRLLFLAAANRDPSAFPDPDRFDISRDPNPHLSFAAGPHFCLGAPLARLHGEVALTTLFTRLPGLAALTPPDITASVPIRQIDHFTVTWNQA